jgi:hypothetical protein
MAIKIGGLYADLILKDGDFRTRMDRAERHVKRLSKEVGATLGPALRGAGIAAIGAGVAMAYSMKKAADEIDTLAKNADRLGIIPEQLKAMQIAADFSGVDSATLVKGFKELVTAGVEAGRGSKPMVDAFAALGIEVKAFNALKPQEQLELVADRIAGLGSAAEQASIAQALFGKGGFELLPVLKEGGAGFARAAELARRYGLAIDRIDAGTVEAANDSITQAGLAWEGLSSQLAVKFAPAVTLGVQKLDDMINKMGGMEVVANGVFESLANGAGFIVDVFQKAIGGLQLLATGMAAVWKNALGLALRGAIFLQQWDKVADLGMMAVEAQKIEDALAGDAFKNLTSGDWAEGVKGFFAEARAEAEARRKAAAAQAMSGSIFGMANGILGGGAAGVEPAAEAAATSLERLEKATEKVEASFLSASEIAGSASGGATGYNRTLANRVERLRERAAIAEASGRFAAADTLNAQAQELDSRIKRRARDADGNVLPMSVIPGAGGASDVPTASIDSTEPPTVETSKGDGGGLVAEVRALVQALNGAAQKLGIA